MDHAAFRSWRPHCVKGRAEVYGHKKRKGEGGEVSMVTPCACVASRKGRKRREVPLVVVKDDKSKMAMAKVVPSEGVQEYAVQVVKKFAELSG